MNPDQELPPSEPQNLAELLWYIKRWESGIYFRVQDANGKWGTQSLAEMGPKTWGEKLARLLEEGRMPVRIREDWEMEKDQ